MAYTEDGTTNKELFQEFEEFSIIISDDEVLVKLEELCKVYGLSAAKIAATWLAYATNKSLPSEPSFELLSQFEREELCKKIVKTPLRNVIKKIPNPKTYNSPLKNESLDGMVLDSYDTPAKGKPQKRQYTPETPPTEKILGQNAFSPGITSSTKYEARTSRGDVACCWGKTIGCTWSSSGTESVVVEHYHGVAALTSRYPFMFEKLKDRAYILNDILEDAASLFKEKYQVEEWAHFCLPSPNELIVAGRICGDSNGKLNSTSLLLEGSMDSCSGQTIALDVGKLSHYAFFPGQIISGIGRNLLGKALCMTSLFEPVYPPFPVNVPTCEPDILQIVIAAGPFTVTDNLLYKPLEDFLNYVVENKPHICIMVGPLLDCRHELIEKNLIVDDFDVTYKRILHLIEKARKESETCFVITSSYHDLAQDYIYPTPPLAFKEFTKLQFVSDPSVLSIDGVVVGVTSTDILFHLGKEETTSKGATDRLGRLAHHILNQQSFYPLYPPNEEVNIDYGYFENHGRLPVMPHVLILPSDLRCFTKDINGCLCINPERLTKGVTGGNFARLQIDTKLARSNYTGSLTDCIKGEIVKI